MKKNNFLLLFAIGSTLLFACEKDKDDDKNPSPTEEETYSVKLNGFSFTPAMGDVYVDTFRNGTDFITQIIADKGDESVVLQFKGNSVGTYSQAGPTGNTNDVAVYYKGLDSVFVCRNSTGGGTLTITKYDIASSKVSGTFSFKAKSSFSPEIKDFTEGTFSNVNIE
jgi:hypothetical protein